MKLKVGDIELDSSPQPQQRRRDHQPPETSADPVRGALAQQQNRERLFGLILVAAALIGGAQVYLGRLPAWGFFTMLGALVALNVIALKAQRALEPPAVEPQLAAPAQALLQERRGRVLRAIAAMGPEGAKFAELERALGWVEPVLAQTLSAMIASDQIEETLDVETGHWSYIISHEVILGWDELDDAADPSGLSLAQRLERTAEDHVITTTHRSKR